MSGRRGRKLFKKYETVVRLVYGVFRIQRKHRLEYLIQNKMQIGLIGMSGVGKTYWAKQLAQIGFECFHCDDMIATQLQNELGKTLETVCDMGSWMGFPYEAGFREKEEKYIAHELQSLQAIVEYLSQEMIGSKNIVIDMTGSVIYAGEDVFKNLRRFIMAGYQPPATNKNDNGQN